MAKTRRKLVVAVVLAVIAGAAWVLWSPRETEPAYKGKPLGFWLEAYVGPGSYKLRYPNGPAQPTGTEASEALLHLGTNAVPYLMGRLEARESETKAKVMKLLQKQHFIKISYTPTIECWFGFFGLERLGPAASNAVPQLVKMLECDPSPFTQQAVPVILGNVGSAAAPAVPALIRHSTHTNWVARCNALFALRAIHGEPKITVPVLINGLGDPNTMVRAQAARGLGAYGKDAEAAVPKLIELWRAEPEGSSSVGTISNEGWEVAAVWITAPPPSPFSSPDVHRLTAEALKSIDPQAAEKAGVK